MFDFGPSIHFVARRTRRENGVEAKFLKNDRLFFDP
jgi:hypothetical protein